MAMTNEGVILPVSRHDEATPDKTGAGNANNKKKVMSPNKDTDAKEAWWKVHLFWGMFNDVRRRAPYYASDWLDAWDYRVIPATIYMYFAK